MALAGDSPSLAIYPCTPVSLVVGFVGDAFLIIDTHCIPADLGGNGNAIIKVVHCNGEVQNGGESVLNWLEKRMISSVGPDRGPDSLVPLSFQEKSTTDVEMDVKMTYFSEIDDKDALILSVTEDFHGSTEGADEECDALLASLPEPEGSSAKSSGEVGHESPISRPDHSTNPGIPTVKQETKDFSIKLWEYPPGRLAHDDNTELIWKGHLTKFQQRAFKRFQLDAIHALEAKKDVIVIQKTGSGKSIVVGSQRFIRQDDDDAFSGDKSLTYGRSVSNQTIESWWSFFFHKTDSDWWIQLFKDVRDSGIYCDDNPIHVECLKFCFMKLIQDELK